MQSLAALSHKPASEALIIRAAERGAFGLVTDLADEGRHVPERWTAAHPPDKIADRIEHEKLGRPMTEDEFGLYVSTFERAYALAADAHYELEDAADPLED